MSEDTIGALSSSIWGGGGDGSADLARAGLDPQSRRVQQIAALAREIAGFPRHLSQHVGGFVITRSRLDEVMPIGNGAMPERTFVEWDKDDLDALGILKIDVLGLGMLSCLRKALDLVGRHYPSAWPQARRAPLVPSPLVGEGFSEMQSKRSGEGTDLPLTRSRLLTARRCPLPQGKRAQQRPPTFPSSPLKTPPSTVCCNARIRSACSRSKAARR